MERECPLYARCTARCTPVVTPVIPGGQAIGLGSRNLEERVGDWGGPDGLGPLPPTHYASSY